MANKMHSIDHPDVMKISKINMKGKLKRSDKKNEMKADKDAMRQADSIQTMVSKKRTKTEGSFMGGGMMKKPMGYTDGGMCRGMGAAIKGGKFGGVK